jgi:hypothetical protein
VGKLTRVASQLRTSCTSQASRPLRDAAFTRLFHPVWTSSTVYKLVVHKMSTSLMLARCIPNRAQTAQSAMADGTRAALRHFRVAHHHHHSPTYPPTIIITVTAIHRILEITSEANQDDIRTKTRSRSTTRPSSPCARCGNLLDFRPNVAGTSTHVRTCNHPTRSVHSSFHSSTCACRPCKRP